MSIHGDPEFVLPASFDAEALLPWKLRRYGDDARYFASTIIRKTARRQADRNGYVALRAEHLRQVMSFRHYRDVIEALLSVCAVHRTPYQVGFRPFGYRLDEEYRGQAHVRRKIECPRLLRRLTQFFASAKLRGQARMLPVHHALARQQHKLRIDGDLAREIIARLPAESNPFDVQGILVADIEQRRFRLSVGKYGRVANSITSMKREVRSALRYKSQPLAGVDIACAQPSLLALLMREIGSQQGGKNVTSYNALLRRPCRLLLPACLLPPAVPVPAAVAVASFADICKAGELFAVLNNRLLFLGFSFGRAEIKRKFLSDVLAKRKANTTGAEYPSPVEDAFREEFPEVWRFIRGVNRDGWEHWRLIRLLQRLESWLVIETVCERFTTQYPKEFVITLHDAVYVRPAAIEKVVETFTSVFDDLDFHMTLKHE